MKKHEWRKHEKSIYLPKAKPEQITLPRFQFITLSGEGSPALPEFTEAIQTLYSMAYAIKMTLKKQAVKPSGYCDFTVYPLEGVWDINETAKKNYTGTVNKADFVYTLMIRQPDFVSAELFTVIHREVCASKPLARLPDVQFTSYEEGACIQMLHNGAFDEEPKTFSQMMAFADAQGIQRKTLVHREIYLSDVRKVAPEKLKTVLRFQVTHSKP